MNQPETQSNLSIIGSTEFIDISNSKNIPAKIDTGADSSAVWTSNINMEPDGTLCFTLFGTKSPFYTGEQIKTTEYTARIIRSSNGIEQIRYRVTLPVTVAGQTFKTAFTLADRSRNRFPILIGRRAISGKFLVDVSKSIRPPVKFTDSIRLNDELSKDPLKFHKKYIMRKESK